MRNAILVMAAVVLAVAAGPAGAAKPSPKTSARPVVVVFDTGKGAGVDKPLAASATTAICVYLRDTKRVDAIVFDRDSPTVLRAIMDKQITADQVASYSSQAERIAVAKALGYDYAAGADMSIKDNMVQFKLWLAKSDGGKKDKWEATKLSEIGPGANSYDNAMQSAASAAVLAVAKEALADLPSIAEKAPSTGAETTAINPDMVTPPAPPNAADYTAQADASLQSGNIAIAIQQYQQAANADPSDADIRLKLADAFARKGMYAEAAAAISRAALLGANKDRIDAARKQLDAMQVGKRASKLEPTKVEPTTTSPAITDSQQTSAAVARSAVSQMLAGDKLWRENKPDEAADAYRAAIKLNPSDWRAYERLALVDASVSMFADARAALEQLSKVQPDPSADTVARRYNLLSSIATQWLTALLKQYDDESADFASHAMTRESYYASIKGLSGRLESMAKFLDAIDVPKDKQSTNLHRSLACGLVSQAASSLQDYLETNNKESKSSAETFVAQARKELDIVKSGEGNRVVARQRVTQPTSDTAGSPSAQPATDTSANNPPSQPQPDNSSQSANQPAPSAGDNSGQEANAPGPPAPPDDNSDTPPVPPDMGPPQGAPAPPPPGPSGPPPPIVPPGVEIQ